MFTEVTQILDQMLIQLFKKKREAQISKSVGRLREIKEVRELERKSMWETPSISVLDGDTEMESRVFFHHRSACFGRGLNRISFEISCFGFQVLCSQGGLYYQRFREEG